MLRKRAGKMIWHAQVTTEQPDGTTKRPLYSLETEDKALARIELAKLIETLSKGESQAQLGIFVRVAAHESGVLVPGSSKRYDVDGILLTAADAIAVTGMSYVRVRKKYQEWRPIECLQRDESHLIHARKRRISTGTILKRRGSWVGRIVLSDGTRPAKVLGSDSMPEQEAREVMKEWIAKANASSGGSTIPQSEPGTSIAELAERVINISNSQSKNVTIAKEFKSAVIGVKDFRTHIAGVEFKRSISGGCICKNVGDLMPHQIDLSAVDSIVAWCKQAGLSDSSRKKIAIHLNKFMRIVWLHHMDPLLTSPIDIFYLFEVSESRS